MPFWDRSLDLVVVTHAQDGHSARLEKMPARHDVAQVIHSRQGCDTPTCKAWDALMMEKEVANRRADLDLMLETVASSIKPVRPDAEMIAVEPAGAPWIGRGKEAIPLIEGITDGLLFEILDGGVADEIIWVSDEDAVNMARRLAREEGLFCGMSGGANVFAAPEVAKRLGKDKTVVAILPDRRDRYLTTERYIT